MTLSMIDISNNQGVIAWDQVAAAGIQAAFAKCSEGVKFADAFLARNLTGMRAAGIAPAVYHFALPAWNSPQDEAAHFLAALGSQLQPGEPIALDMERDPYGGTLPRNCGPWAVAWLTAVQSATGCLPLVYTNRDLIQNYGLGAAAATGAGLWLAAPGVADPAIPAPWQFLAMQQTSWTASIPGIATEVDQDVFFGDLAAFRRYGAQQPQQLIWDDAARLQLIQYVCGGSGVGGFMTWLLQYSGG
jgi:lysozyme